MPLDSFPSLLPPWETDACVPLVGREERARPHTALASHVFYETRCLVFTAAKCRESQFRDQSLYAQSR